MGGPDVGLGGVRVDVARMRTPDGHSWLELTKFHVLTGVSAGPENLAANMTCLRRIVFGVEGIEDVLARLRTHGADLVGEMEQYVDRRAGRAAQLEAVEGGRSPEEWCGHGSGKMRGKAAVRQ